MNLRWNYTRESPGCICCLRDYLSEITGLPKTELLVLKNRMTLKDAQKKKKQTGNGTVYIRDSHGKWILRPEQITLKGGISVLRFGPYDPNPIPATTLFEIAIECLRPIDAFGIHLKDAGNYRECLGGGWHCYTPLYEVDGYFFASLECNH